MKKIRNIFLVFMLGIVSQSSAFDVCAGDFLEKYEKKFEEIKENHSKYCNGFLNKSRQNEIQNAMRTNDTAKKLQVLLNLGIAIEYNMAINTTELMLKVCSPNIQKLKARKAYFDMTVMEVIVGQIAYCERFCKIIIDKSSCM